MGSWITGELRCVIRFHTVFVEDGQSENEAIFPEGYEGEMIESELVIKEKFEEKETE